MITAGLRLAQGGSIAVIRDDRLEISVDAHRPDDDLGSGDAVDLSILPRLFAEQNYDIAEVDDWVINGWHGAAGSHVPLRDGEASLTLDVAPYVETGWAADPNKPVLSGTIELGGDNKSYTSYLHLASQVAAAYCTSPFARREEPAMVLVWDDGSFPRLYYVDTTGQIQPGGELFPLVGPPGALAGADHEPAAHGAGVADAGLKATVAELFHECFEDDRPGAKEYRDTVIGCGSTAEPSEKFMSAFRTELRRRTAAFDASWNDVRASVQEFVGELVLERLGPKVRAWRGDSAFNLCVTGSGALGQAYNSALLRHPMVRSIWVPPFPDASGSAIGAAALHRAAGDGLRKLDWNVASGPELRRPPHLPEGWSASPCRPEELARMLSATGKPVVVLHGRQKLGPRALGTRSVLAPVTDRATRELLDSFGDRDAHEPPAAICPIDSAAEVFELSGPDPYTAFEHRVRPDWAQRIPAVLSPDGLARVQTVDPATDPLLTTILREYHKWSGVPLLCTTAARRSRGRDVFPDTASAMRWGAVDAVWSHGVLHQRMRSSDADRSSIR